MIIDFSKIEETIIKNFHGGEKDTKSRMFTDDANRIMHGKLEPGSSIGLHKHENNCEVIYVLEGSGKMLYDDTQEELTAGMCHYCPKGHSHSFINNGSEDLIYFAVVAKQ